MAYKVTYYCNDSKILETSAEFYNSNGALIKYSHEYGDDVDLGPWSDFTFVVDSDYSEVTFRVTPDTGCKFSHWVYRVGSTTATERTSTSNPFTYTGGQDIYIRAVGTEIGGGDDDDTWACKTGSIGTLSGIYSKSFSFDRYNLIYCYSVSFTNSGVATFYTTGDCDTVGYLTQTTSWSVKPDEYGNDVAVPRQYLQTDDESGGDDNDPYNHNFSISHEVSANTTYYIWIRTYVGQPDEPTILHIKPPGGLEPWDWEIGQGTDRDTAYKAITNNGLITDFKYTVWNELVEKTYEVACSDKTNGWNNDVATYDATKMTATDREMTAKRFNSLRYNIDQGSVTGMPIVGVGNIIKGEYFITLATHLNNWINKL